MSRQREIRWLYGELPGLIAKGILTESQAEALREHYGPEGERHSPDLATIIIGALGALLIGGGIILIIAYNWDGMSRGWRTLISFLPLVEAQAIYSYVFLRRRESLAWVEGSSAFLFLMIGASTALVSQTYHITGTMSGYLFGWALLSIPLMYLMNASLPAVLYLMGIAWWAVLQEGNEGVIYWGLLAAALPHLAINLKPDRSPFRRHVLGWALVLPFFVAWWWVTEPRLTAYAYLGTALVLTNLYLLGPLVYPDHQSSLLRPPFTTASVIAIFFFVIFLTFRPELKPMDFDQLLNGYRLAPWAARLNLIVLLLLFLAYFRLFLSAFSSRYPVGHAVWFFPFVILVYIMLASGPQKPLAMLIANLYTFAIGLTYLVSGLRTHSLGRVNTGLIFILVLAAARFFDANWNFIIKGIGFVLLGTGFLVANVVLARRMKANAH